MARNTRTVRVGVTGHRAIADVDAVRAASIDAIDRLRRDPASDVEINDMAVRDIEIWSSLAEGADRLVAELVPTHAARLVVILPLDPDDYRNDFDTESSRAAFDSLLESAARIEITGPDPAADAAATRESAYERAGLAIVERCDVLLALWDGAPSRGRGGTAEIVGAARERGRTVIHIPVVRIAS